MISEKSRIPHRVLLIPFYASLSIRLQTGTKSYIGEFDERHNEISHSYGYTR